MSWDLPAPTLTRNLSYPCSDHKVHPTENRVLSLAEACKLQSISDYDYQWGPITIRGKQKEIAPDTVITDCIGESIPPTFTEMLIRYFLAITERSVPIVSVPTQRSLFAHE
jgi:DNA (cytosine-5)-methyltransferase 1